MRRGSFFLLGLLWLVSFGVAAAVIELIPWLPDPASREAGRIWFVYAFVTWISAVIFAVVTSVLAYAVLRFRAPAGDMSDGPPIHGHTGLEISWTAVPFLLVTSIAIVSAIVLARNSNAGPDPLRIHVTTMQFTFQFTYPNGKTFTELRLPKDRKVLLSETSDDVIHSFWVPEFGQKQDAVPGITTKLVITPDKTGHFPIICTQLCGLGHALMRSTAIVLTPSAYDAWYKGAGAPSSSQAGGAAAAGAAGGATAAASIFKTTCGACHTLTAAGTTGKIGPDLDHLQSDAAKAGQALEPYVRQSIEDPNAYVVPGYQAGVMSSACCKQFSSSQVGQLVQYLVEKTK